MGAFTGIFIAIASAVSGFFIGKYAVKVWGKKEDKKILKNAYEVLDGKRKNITEIDGQNLDVNTFRVRDENNEEKKIILNKNLLKN